MMSSGLAKQDNRFVTLFLFTQAFDILLDCNWSELSVIPTIIPLGNLEADTWIQQLHY